MDRASAQTPIYIEPGPVTWDSTTNQGTFPVYFTSTEAIAGFQFDVVFDSPTGILSGAGGGLAGTYGYDIGTGATTVLGFSITLTEIPPANTPESLVDIFITTTSGDPDYGTICLENPVFADVAANSLPVTIGPCWPSSVLLRTRGLQCGWVLQCRRRCLFAGPVVYWRSIRELSGCLRFQ